MSPGRWPPSLVMDVQVLVTHASHVTIMEREMGHPPRIIGERFHCSGLSAPCSLIAPGDTLVGFGPGWHVYCSMYVSIGSR